MTQKEIEKFLADTKVYVNGRSREIQEKLFSFGYTWDTGIKIIQYTEYPFLFIYADKSITFIESMDWFVRHKNRKITADDILSLELDAPRPFLGQAECLHEMLKHKPFGWLYDRYSGDYVNVSSIQDAAIELMPQVDEETIKDRIIYGEAFKRFTFLDGSTFGIKQ